MAQSHDQEVRKETGGPIVVKPHCRLPQTQLIHLDSVKEIIRIHTHGKTVDEDDGHACNSKQDSRGGVNIRHADSAGLEDDQQTGSKEPQKSGRCHRYCQRGASVRFLERDDMRAEKNGDRRPDDERGDGNDSSQLELREN